MTGEFYQQLAHDNDIVQTVTAYHRGDLSFVATTSTGKGNNICVKIWHAKRAAGSPQDATETLFVATLLALERVILRHTNAAQGAVAMSATTIASLAIVWAVYQVCCRIPWLVLLHLASATIVQGAVNIRNAASTTWQLCRLGMSKSVWIVNSRIASLLEWARIKTLVALGIPLDILARLTILVTYSDHGL
ncbi:hypothetical protein WOLCODRAFT_166164 [Wolfiporia cocos MD-104 SS10]|uniref:Uncharacterized protein n=1 Tax=Wolfiporia cocos (strain MD-104) TaxID=742152 RepID=A0A2H3JGY2_WOLCO|nr:hypothetical protein WOLCODRAFT_166164 [Wolfiporia cocos MD-104 SS10]